MPFRRWTHPEEGSDTVEEVSGGKTMAEVEAITDASGELVTDLGEIIRSHLGGFGWQIYVWRNGAQRLYVAFDGGRSTGATYEDR